MFRPSRPGSAPPGSRPPDRTRRSAGGHLTHRIPQGAARNVGSNSKVKEVHDAGPVSFEQIKKLIEAASERPLSDNVHALEPASPYAQDGECLCCRELLDGFEGKLRAEMKILRQDFASAIAQQVKGELGLLRSEMHELFAESKSPKRIDVNFKDVITEIRKSRVDLRPILEQIDSLAKSVDHTPILRRIDSLRIDEKVLSPVLTQNKTMLETLLSQMEDISVDLTPVLDAIAKLNVQNTSTGSINEALNELKTNMIRKEDMMPVTEHLASLKSSTGHAAQSIAKIGSELHDQVSPILREVSSTQTIIHSQIESMATVQQSEKKRLDEKLQPILQRIKSSMDHFQTEKKPVNHSIDDLHKLVEQVLEEMARYKERDITAGESHREMISKLNALQGSFDLTPVMSRMDELQVASGGIDDNSGFEQVLEAIADIDLYSIEQKVDGLEESLKGFQKQAINTPETGTVQALDLEPLLQKISGFQASNDEYFKKILEMQEVKQEEMRKQFSKRKSATQELSQETATASALDQFIASEQDSLSVIQSQLQELQQAVLAQGGKEDSGGMSLSSIKEVLKEVKPTVDFTEVLEEIKKIKVRGLNPDLVLERIEDLRLMQRKHTEKMDEEWFTPVMHKIQCINASQNDMRDIIAERLEKSLDLSPVLDAVRTSDNNGLARYNETLKEVRRVKVKDEDFKTILYNIDTVKHKFDLNFKPLFHRIDNMKLDPDFKPVLTSIELMKKALLAKQAEIDLSPVMKAIGKIDTKAASEERQRLLEAVQKITFGADEFKPILERIDTLQQKLDFAPILEQITSLKTDEDTIVEKINAMQEDVITQRDTMAAVDLSPLLKAIGNVRKDIEGIKKQMEVTKSYITGTAGGGPEGGGQNRGTAAAELTIWPALGYSELSGGPDTSAKLTYLASP